jgi:NAD(P)-dependent dehydrogenase (short-subunit alcohol dehydrogenase family)
MSERVAILAGAGGELSRVTAQKLANAGFLVVGIDRNEDGLKQLPEGIRFEVGDPTGPLVARSLVDRIAVEIGSPEVLVNTVGTYRVGEALDVTPEDLRLMIEVNAGTALWLTQAVAPYVRECGSGAIVHVAARQGFEPTAGMATYGVSKAALVHLTRVLYLELPAWDPGQRCRTPDHRHRKRTGRTCLPTCSRTQPHPRRSPTPSPTSSVMKPQRQ